VTPRRPAADDALGLALALVRLAAEAGRRVLAADSGDAHVKPDGSPVTAADVAAEAVILAGLGAILPGVPVLSEERAAAGELPRAGGTLLVVDPLDGTREYVAGRAEYTVNIALVHDGRPAVGVLHAPALGRSWVGAVGAGALGARHAPGDIPMADAFAPVATRAPRRPPAALVSRSHLDSEATALLDRLGVRERRGIGSALKFGLLAEGEADLYPRFGPTMEWDIAAGDALLTAAGGAVLDPAGMPLRYAKAGQGYRTGPFVAWGRPP
jgi:3'(2'), 5'-bisphosphate nucleotidase